jgi:hypothetical protein
LLASGRHAGEAIVVAEVEVGAKVREREADRLRGGREGTSVRAVLESEATFAHSEIADAHPRRRLVRSVLRFRVGRRSEACEIHGPVALDDELDVGRRQLDVLQHDRAPPQGSEGCVHVQVAEPNQQRTVGLGDPQAGDARIERERIEADLAHRDLFAAGRDIVFDLPTSHARHEKESSERIQEQEQREDREQQHMRTHERGHEG